MNRVVKYLSVILKWRRLIFWNTVVLTTIAVVVSFVLPYRYTATAQLLPPSDEGDIFGLTSLLGGGASGLSKLKAGLTGSSTASDLMIGILGSRTVMQHVADRCSIAKYYGIRKPSPEKSIRKLKDMTKFGAEDNGIVRVTVEARTRELAARVANTYVAELDSFLRFSNISRGHNMRIFLEKRIVQLDSTLAAAGESLKAFQQANKVSYVEDETKAAIDVYAKLKSELSLQEAEYEAVRSGASDENPYIDNLRREVQASRDELRKLELGRGANGFGVGFGVSFEHLPVIAAQFARKYLDFKVQQEAYAALYEQYEYARVLEARDAPTLTVLDYAVPPERRSFPRRTFIAGLVFLFGLGSGIAFALIAEYFGFIRNARPDEYQNWRSVGRELTGLLRGRRFSVSHRH